MVKDFAGRGDDDLAILVRQRLSAASYIHDAKSYMRKADLLPGIESITVGAPVPDRGGHAPQRLKGHAGRHVPRDARYPTHWTGSVEFVVRQRFGCGASRLIFRAVIGTDRSRELGRLRIIKRAEGGTVRIGCVAGSF